MSDYISREEIRDCYVSIKDVINSHRNDNNAILNDTLDKIDFYVFTYLNKCPSADVRENVKGEWIEKYIEREGYCYFCSNCNLEVLESDLSNFCPNCGADMRGKKE